MDQNWLTADIIVRVNEYECDDDKSKRDKYMVVLYHDSQNALIIDCLTTSKSKGVTGLMFGCSIHDGRFPYFVFPAGHIIGASNFYFDLDTYIFFKDNIRLEPVAKFNRQVAMSIFGLAKLDELSADDLKRLVKCALKSKFVPTGIAKLLAEFKSSLG